MITKNDYINYLIVSAKNFTCTQFASISDGVVHDSINKFLNTSKQVSQSLFDAVKSFLKDSPTSFIIVDDSVQEKAYARFIKMVKRQYSGNKHGLVKGINLVNMVHTNGKSGDFFPIDYRIYSPESDKKTKNEHFREMFIRMVAGKQLKAKTILFDSWYASVDNLKLIHRNHWIFFTTLKNNRLVMNWQLTPQDGAKNAYMQLAQLEWTETELIEGKLIKVSKLPFVVKLFKIVAPNGDIEWVITNDLTSNLSVSFVKETTGFRWQIEEFHRSFKQLTGSESCQSRTERSQRNHLNCCYHAWLSMAIKARQENKTIYQVKNEQYTPFLKQLVKSAKIKAVA
jgi:Transposase DDE domain